MSWIRFAPASLWYFRAPSPLEPGVHGPGVSRGSLSYPLPSTIAGFLAGVGCGWRGSSQTSSSDEYGDVRSCLSRLAGGEEEQSLIRPGLALVEGRLAAYIGGPSLAWLEDLLGLLERLARIAAGPRTASSCLLGRAARNEFREAAERGWRPRRLTRTGIALNRMSKTVLEGYLYSVEAVDWSGGEILVYAEGIELPGSRVVGRLGGEGGVAIATTNGGPEEEYGGLVGRGRGDTAMVALITPALLSDSPLQGVIDPVDQSTAAALAEKLLPSDDCVESSEAVYVPKTSELSLSVYFPGWSVAEGRPRRPHLVVPAGTIIRVKARSSGCLEKKLRELAIKGVGSHGDLGWGSIAYALS